MNDDIRVDTQETRAVREGENLDWRRLEAYLRDHSSELANGVADLAHITRDPMTIKQFAGGHSNLTYLVRFGKQEFVLRRPPFGRLPPRAHDMRREYRVLHSIHDHFPLAPRPLLLCEDTEVIGATFYLMEWRDGFVIRTREPEAVAGRTQMRRRISEAVVDTLAALHRVDVRQHDLARLGKPAGFVRRQVEGWTMRWHNACTETLTSMNSVAAWLVEHLPADAEPPALVHGDFKLDNIALDTANPQRVVAVFDWEMSAIGDPLIDLGILLSYWTHAPAALDSRRAATLAGVTHLPGWLTRDELIERYAKISVRDVSNIKFYEVFAVFKLAVIAQQIFFRFHHGQTNDLRFARFGDHARLLAERAVMIKE